MSYIVKAVREPGPGLITSQVFFSGPYKTEEDADLQKLLVESSHEWRASIIELAPPFASEPK